MYLSFRSVSVLVSEGKRFDDNPTNPSSDAAIMTSYVNNVSSANPFVLHSREIPFAFICTLDTRLRGRFAQTNDRISGCGPCDHHSSTGLLEM